jgi:hypothetical protein
MQATMPSTGGPFVKLLRNTKNDLCLSCHDGVPTIPDVLGEHNPETAYIRQAGALNRNDTGDYKDHTGHTLGSTDSPPGYVAPTGDDPPYDNNLDCVDCHNPHGDLEDAIWTDVTYTGTAYRNLDTTAGGAATGTKNVSYTLGSGNNVLTTDVYVAVDTGGFDVPGTPDEYYAMGNIYFNEPDVTQSGMGVWCEKCHDNFHSVVGSGTDVDGTLTDGGFKRHPTAGVNINATDDGGRHTGSQGGNGYAAGELKVMDSAGTWSALDGPETPTCITCHKAHGNKNTFGLIYGANTSEEGAGSSAPDLCKLCHANSG